MPTEFDTRPWNLLAGVAAMVAAGCSGRTASTDTGSDTTGDPDSSTDSATDSTDDPAECVENSDCPTGYYCVDGICEYLVAPDGGPWFDCYSNADCGPLTLCVDNYCEPVASPPSCGEPVFDPPLPFELGIPESILTMAFADADDDGREELVAVSEFSIYTMAPEWTDESPRVIESPALEATVVGDFDGNPGEDIALLHDDTLWIHAADGLGSFAAPTESVSPIVGAAGLRAGDFDGVGLDELLVFGDGGASVAQLGGQAMPLTMNGTPAATARELDQSGGFALRNSDTLEFYALDGAALTSSPVAEPNAAGPLTSAHWSDAWYDLSATFVSSNQATTWTAFEQWAPGSGERVRVWGLEGETLAMARADLDGDGHDELVLIHANLVWVLRDVGGPNECLEQQDFDHVGLGDPDMIAVGDYDGDGDDDFVASFPGWMFIRDAAG